MWGGMRIGIGLATLWRTDSQRILGSRSPALPAAPRADRSWSAWTGRDETLPASWSPRGSASPIAPFGFQIRHRVGASDHLPSLKVFDVDHPYSSARGALPGVTSTRGSLTNLHGGTNSSRFNPGCSRPRHARLGDLYSHWIESTRQYSGRLHTP